MTTAQLKEKLLKTFEEHGVSKIHPLHDAMLDECCETALKNPGESEQIYLMSARIGFITANATLRGLLKAALLQADSVTLNYRGQSFSINNTSALLNEY